MKGKEEMERQSQMRSTIAWERKVQACCEILRKTKRLLRTDNIHLVVPLLRDMGSPLSGFLAS